MVTEKRKLKPNLERELAKGIKIRTIAWQKTKIKISKTQNYIF